MDLVMNKVSKLKKKTNTYEVTVGGKTYEISPLFVMKYNLHEDRKLTLDELASLINDELIERNTILAQKKLSKMMTTFELKEFLREKEAPEFVVNEVVKKMKRLNLLNDELYIENYIDTHPNYGPRKLSQKLREKGAPFTSIDEIVYSKNYDDNMMNLIKKRIRRPGRNNKTQLETKTINYLINAGFDKDRAAILVRKEVSKLTFNNDQLIEGHLRRIYPRYEKRYEKDEVQNRVYNYLLARGFNKDDIQRAITKYKQNK